MKKLIAILLVGVGIYGYVRQNPERFHRPAKTAEVQGRHAGGDDVSRAFDTRKSNVQVRGSGRVDRVLSDDLVGSRHQRFILRLPSGQTVLVAHNIDLAPKITSLSKGDSVEFYGEYEWNAKGGVIHWTHHDPKGSHVGGWLKSGGRTYQ